MNNIQKLKEAQNQGLRVQCKDITSTAWIDCLYRIHPDDEQKFIDPELKTENPEKISEKPPESSENPKEFMEILDSIQKTLLKSSKDFKFSYETQGDKIKIEVLIQKDSVKQEDEGWISNVGNNRGGGSYRVDLDYDMLLDVVYRSGDRERILFADTSHKSWQDNDLPSDIMKFRIIK
jgi:hypothetical protein